MNAVKLKNYKFSDVKPLLGRTVAITRPSGSTPNLGRLSLGAESTEIFFVVGPISFGPGAVLAIRDSAVLPVVVLP